MCPAPPSPGERPYYHFSSQSNGIPSSVPRDSLPEEHQEYPSCDRPKNGTAKSSTSSIRRRSHKSRVLSAAPWSSRYRVSHRGSSCTVAMNIVPRRFSGGWCSMAINRVSGSLWIADAGSEVVEVSVSVDGSGL
ncbi:hypothetical protein ANO11243_053700 [Dothideomycetidae sp. 11243]|nr:hypothetical protein ANO11243_053700 [fungal sp. No.11243]